MNKEDKEMWLTIIGFYLTAGVVGYLISEFILK
jgi:hypothetical protein